MKKILKYLSWLPFAICFGSLTIYIVYTVIIKMNPAIIVTEKLTTTLKTYLIISLISLFVGLLIVLIGKVFTLFKEDSNLEIKVKKKKEKKLIVKEEKKDNKIEVKPINSEIKESSIEEKINSSIENENNVKKHSFKLEAVSCSECGGLISKDAAVCPHCGVMFDEEILKLLNKRDRIIEKKRKKSNIKVVIANIFLIIIFLFLIFLISNSLLNKKNENSKNISEVIVSEKQA